MENKEKKFLNKKRGRNPNGRNGHLNQNRNNSKSFNKSEENKNYNNEENKNKNQNKNGKGNENGKLKLKEKENEYSNNSERKKDTFNTGDFKKKYNKEYILSKQKPKFGRKFDKKDKNSREEKININHNNLNLTLMENTFQKAKEIYEKKVKKIFFILFYFIIKNY
jgi:hypothetical protein